MKLEKEATIYKIHQWHDMLGKTGADITINISGLLDEELNKLNTIASKDKVKLTLEIENSILDEVEKKYLRGVIKPFRDRVRFIRKNDYLDGSEYLSFYMTDEPSWSMSLFKRGSMYKNMELNKKYTLEDLGL